MEGRETTEAGVDRDGERLRVADGCDGADGEAARPARQLRVGPLDLAVEAERRRQRRGVEPSIAGDQRHHRPFADDEDQGLDDGAQWCKPNNVWFAPQSF